MINKGVNGSDTICYTAQVLGDFCYYENIFLGVHVSQIFGEYDDIW